VSSARSTEARTTTRTALREIHRAEGGSQNWDWHGTLNTEVGTVSWRDNAETSDARYDKTTAVTMDNNGVHVYTGADGPTPAETLRYDTVTVTGDRIRYQQTAFVEYQNGDSTELRQDALFWAAKASDEDEFEEFTALAREHGALARGWDFDSSAYLTSPMANYPATNKPWDGWYQEHMAAAGAVE
jgi:hypothetical protein